LEESIIYYTFHKTASSYFSNIVLGNIENLKHIDYSNNIYFRSKKETIDVEKFGKAYGPIRLSNNPILKDHVFMYENVILPFLNHKNTKSIKSIFQIRDPRDILVSNYYHQARGYVLSENLETKLIQENTINKARNTSIDEFIIDDSIINFYLESFKLLGQVYDNAERKILLKYEDMIDNWDVYIQSILSIVPIKKEFINTFYKDTRPELVEQRSKHKRSGKTGDFRMKLNKHSIDYLNNKFKPIIEKYNYQF
jgi:hypothetical protein